MLNSQTVEGLQAAEIEALLRESRNFGVPPQTAESISLYVVHGICAGHALRQVLANDLNGAVAACDHFNRRMLPEISDFIVKRTPPACHGSFELVDAWKGLDFQQRFSK